MLFDIVKASSLRRSGRWTAGSAIGRKQTEFAVPRNRLYDRRLSGAKRPGLIEASDPSSARPPGWLAERLSGAKRPGLIEAWPVIAVVRDPGPSIEAGCGIRSPAPRLSGAKRPGLIEAVRRRAQSMDLGARVRLSGAKRPGLIEASTCSCPCGYPPLKRARGGSYSRQCALSGAKRPGLIEAPPTAGTDTPRSRVIRGQAPRPH